MTGRRSLADQVAEAEAALRAQETELRGRGYSGPPLDLARREDEGIVDWLRRAERMLSAKEAELRAAERGERIVPGDRVGAVPAGDRVVTQYSGGRDPVTYPRGSLWLVVGVLVVLFLVFFGTFLLFFR